MKNRYCDGCEKIIESKGRYISLRDCFYDGKQMITKAAGDLCLVCYKKIKEEKLKG